MGAILTLPGMRIKELHTAFPSFVDYHSHKPCDADRRYKCYSLTFHRGAACGEDDPADSGRKYS